MLRENHNKTNQCLSITQHLTQQKPFLLICCDFVSKPREPLRCLQVYGTLAARGHCFSNTEPLVSNCWQKSVNCLFARSPPRIKVCTKRSLESPLHSLHKTIKLSPFDLQLTVRCPPFFKLVCWLSVLTVYDIYRIFRELQHSLTRLQHRYCDVTILMGW
jgi:hypothetical protein